MPQPVMALVTVLITLVSFFKLGIQVCHGSADLSDIVPSPLVRPLGPLESSAAQTISIIPLSRQKSQFFFARNPLEFILHISQADAPVDCIERGVHDGLPDIMAD